jgi:hypothetical protein
LRQIRLCIHVIDELTNWLSELRRRKAEPEGRGA